MVSKGYVDNAVISNFLDRYPNITSRVRYQATVNEFMNLAGYREINNITKDQILDYMECIKDNAAKVCHFKEFIKFLNYRHLLDTSVENDGNFINLLYNFRAIQKDTGRAAIKYPINVIIQIDYDIKTNYKKPLYENKRDYERIIKIAFLWELIFDADIPVTDIKGFKARYIIDKSEYIKSGKKNQLVDLYYDGEPNTVKTIIGDYYNSLLTELDRKKDGFTTLTCLETYNNDELQVYGLLAQDIIAARNKFYIKCPNCDKTLKTIPENWIFVQYEKNSEKYLVCSHCKGYVYDER